MPQIKRSPVLEKSRYSSADASPGYLFWKTFNAWQRKVRLELDALNITQVQYSILATLSYISSAKDFVSQQDVANRLSMDKMTISDVVKTLEGKSLIVRERSATDGRAYALKLTSNAVKLLKLATPVVEGVDEIFFGILTKTDRTQFITYLLKLNDDVS